MRGNGINCLRIVPYSAVQFTTYEQLKKVSTARAARHPLTRPLQWFSGYGATPLDTPTRLASGALAGITSVCASHARLKREECC